MIGEKIIHDLELLPVKDTDSVSEIDRTTDDYLYFQLNEVYFEDDNEKARQQTIITANAMDKTMHSLNKEIEQSFTSGAELSKSIMMESYNKYNNALDLSSKGFYTSALRVIDEAKNLNPKDSDILNLAGMLNLLACNFKVASNTFYENLCINQNIMANDYIELMVTSEYKDLLNTINHILLFYKDENYEDVIKFLINERKKIILDLMNDKNYVPMKIKELAIILNVKKEDRGLLEIVLNEEKAKEIMDELSEINADYKYFNIEKKRKEQKEEAPQKVEEKKTEIKKMKVYKKIIAGGLIVLTLSSSGVYIYNLLKPSGQTINSITSVKSEKTEGEKSEPMEEGRQELLYTQASECRQNEEYDKAIEYYKLILEYGTINSYLENSLYNLAVLSEELDDTDSAISYLKQYIEKYNKDDLHYDASYYRLLKLYLAEGNDSKAKETAKQLEENVPSSKYLDVKEVKRLLK